MRKEQITKKLEVLAEENRLLKQELQKYRQEASSKQNSTASSSFDEPNQSIKRLHEQYHELANLATHNAIITGEVSEAKKILTEVISRQLHVQRASIWMLSDKKNHITCIDIYLADRGKHLGGLSLSLKSYPNYFKYLQNNTLINAPDAMNDPRLSELKKDYLIPNNIHSLLEVFVYDESGEAGVVCVENTREKRNWTPDDINFARIIASLYVQASTIARKKEIQQQLIKKYQEYETQNEEYLLLNKELQTSLDELQRSTERIRQSESQLNNIINSVDDVIWSQNVEENKPVFMSSNAKKVLGRDAEEFYKDAELWSSIVHPEDRDSVQKKTKNYQPARYLEMEYRVVFPDGRIKWVFDRVNITYDKNNKPIRFDGLLSDITERKTAREQLNLSEKTYKGIIDSINDAIYIQDRDGYILDVNKAVERIEGYSKEEILGKNVDFLSPENKNDLDAIKKCLKKAYQGTSQLFEFWGESKDGKEYIQEVNLSSCFYFGKKAVIAVARDITSQKYSELKIKEQSNRLNTILKTMPDLLFVIDKNGFYREVITQDLSQVVVDPEKIDGIHTTDVFGKTEGERHIQHFRKCLKTRELQKLEYQIKERDKVRDKVKCYEARLSPLDDEHVLAIVRDITNLKENELLLEKERDQMQALMDNIPDTIYFKDTQSRFTRINRAQASLLGINDTTEALGKTDFDFFEEEHAQEAYLDEKKIFKSGKGIVSKMEKLKTNLGWKWMYSTKVPIRNKQGKITGLVGVSRDITELKKIQNKLTLSEEKYRNLTENAFDGIYMRNDKYFEYVNDRFCQITGYSKKELTSKNFNFRVLLDEATRQLIEQRKVDYQKRKIPPQIYEGTIIHKNGGAIEVEFSTTFTQYTDKQLVMGIIRDITERKNNEKLKTEVTLTRKSAEFKQRFLANMSHEIRTPLTGILGMVDILNKTPLNDTQKDYINTLKQSGVTLREIINLILDYSKIEAGKIRLKKSTFALGDIADSTEALFHSICEKNIKWQTKLDSEVPAYIVADEHRIIQIINNLISNAVKYTITGKIVLKVTLAQQPKTLPDSSSDLKIKISVTDTGIGIAKKKQKELFLPFSQIGQDDRLQFSGTGLGLSICKELSELMGGEIGVKSEPGKGSTFWFTFQAAKPDSLPEEKTKTPAKKAKPFRSLNILFAEDQKINQAVISLMLKEAGHKCIIVNNGKELVEKFKPGAYDLILMDIKMPVMDGITATNILKKKYDNLPPIVGLSANAFEGDREKYIQAGMDEYLTKPLKMDDFLHVIQEFDV